MTTGLLGDTSFLDTLQQASQVLNDRVSSSPFGNYTPSQASDYVVGPLGGIAQNKFMGDQFQTPNLFNAPYIPEAFNASSVLNAASTSPFNYNFGSYTPGAFNQFYGSPMASPAMATTTVREGGRGGDRLADALGGGLALERIGGMNLSIDPLTGRIEVLDPSSISSSLLTDLSAIQKFTPAGLLNSALGGTATDYGKQLDRIEQQFGKPVADEIAATVRESYGVGKATPSGVLSTGLQVGDKVDLGGGIKGFINSQGNFQRGTPIGQINTSKPEPKQETKQEPSGKATTGGASKSKQEGNRALGKSRGFNFGGR